MRPDGNSRSRAMLLLLCGLLLTLGQTIGAQSHTFTANTTITTSNTKYENYDITVSGCTVTIDGKHSFHSLTVESSGIVTHDPQNSPNFAGGMNLNIATNCDIQVGCAINAVGKGWAGGAGSSPALGPGAGSSDTIGSYGGGGGSYGGEALADYYNVNAGGAVYDDLTLKAPTDLGSGGGSGLAGQYAGGAGGGAIQMTVGGTLQVDGQLVADGQNGNVWGGGGSGGSIYLIVGTLSGGGFISANGGGTVAGGSGSGGRIAVCYTTNSFAAPPPATTGYNIRAAGGYTNIYSAYAGAGTVFLQQVGQTQGDLWVHNQGIVENANAYTSLQDPLTFDNVYVWGQGVLSSQQGKPLALTVLSNVTVSTGGWISATRRGYSGGFGPFPALGPGAGSSDTIGSYGGGGGSYGGEALADYYNVNAGGAVYDDLTLKAPTDLGSGGGSGLAGQYAGGAGGGAIQMTVGGTLQVDGQLTADGQPEVDGQSDQYGGGGSGGSIYLMVGTLSGGGFISAGGGGTSFGAPGGGGRIAIYYTTTGFAAPPPAMTGYNIRAAGGYTNIYSAYAGAGTVFLQQVGQTQGDLWVHNQGIVENANAYTPLQDAMTFDNVYVWGRGVLASPYGSPLTLQVLGTLDIYSDGTLSAAGRGYAGASASRPAGGPGAGVSDITGAAGGGGGGYGGAGDVGYNGVNPGGMTYGSVTEPTDLGSGGGSGYRGAYAGGAGGGAIHAIVNGLLQVDGWLVADGGIAGVSYVGGGSGGSIWLVTNTLSGIGLISATGGSYQYGYFAGGGGGRIAIYTFTNNFANGTIAAAGGKDGGPGGSLGTANVYPTSGISLQAITLAATTLPEGQSTTGAVTLSGPAPSGGVTVTLTPSNSTVAQIPTSVTVPAGQQGATFPITANPSATAGSVTLSAALGGVAQSVTLDVEPWIATVTLKPTAVPGGTNSTGTVSLNFPAPLNGLPVNLASGNTAVATVLGSVTVPQGKMIATFTVSTSKSVASETPVTISATYGPEAPSATLNVDPSGVALRAFTLSPSTVVGGNVCIGTVSLTGKAPAGGAVVALSSANPSPVLVPALLTIPQGQSSAAFVISTPQVIATQSASISATLGTVTKVATLKIQPTGVASLILVPTTVQGGVETAIGIVTLQSAVRTNTVVTITSSKTAYAMPDATVVIPAGALTGTFNIDTATNATGKSIKAVITATANTIAKTYTLTIN